MTTNVPTPTVPRRLGWVVAALLLLLLLLGGAAGVWWVRYRPAGPGDGPPKTDGPGAAAATGQVCSDDDDPKYLEHLDFGPPVATRFDRGRLDALPNRPIPDLEKYPWQPPELVAVLGEHRMRGQLFAASPDGAKLAVGSPGDPFLRIGPTDTIHEKAVLSCPGGAYALAWEPGGDRVAVSCGDGVVRRYDVRDLDKIPDPAAFDKAAGMVTHLAYSGDGKYLLGGDNTPKLGVAWVWDADSRKVVHQLKHSGPVMGVAFSPVPGDYRALTGGGAEDGRLHLWSDAVKSDEQRTIEFAGKFDTTTYVGQVAFSPDGKQAASAHSDAVVRLWDLTRFELHQEIHGLGEHVPGAAPVLAYSPDGRYLATGRHNDGGVWLYDAGTGGRVRVLATAGAFNEIRFLGKGGRVAFTSNGGNDWNVHIHEVETGNEFRPPVGHLNAVGCVSFAPDGRNVASGGTDVAVRVWDLDSLSQRCGASGGGVVWGVGFLPDAKTVYYYGSAWATLPLLDVESGKARTPTYSAQHNGAILSAAVTRDGRFALTGGYQDGTVRLWRLSDGRQVRYFDLRKDPSQPQGVTVAATLSPDMHRAVATADGRTLLLQLRCQHVLHEWPAATSWAPFLPDAQVAFFGGADAPVWEVTGDDPREIGRIGLNFGGVTAPALSGDAKRVAGVQGARAFVSGVDAAKVWEWTPPPHFGGVHGVALSPDGRDLLTANGDGTVYVIRLP